MYAVIRAGGKQYRVAPGDVIRVEKQTTIEGTLQFELLAVGDNGQISSPRGEARVVGQVVREGRGDKVLVFHYKRKKQYKKLAGHRQPFLAVRITEISYDGQTVKAPELLAPPVKPKASTGGAAPDEGVAPKKKSGSGAGSKARSGGSTKKSGPRSKAGNPPKSAK
jgi:large subunit ribosomal protein L21